MDSIHTALITGASAGIGAEFARQLARQGFNLILTARRGERLLELSDTIQQQNDIKIEVITADLSRPEDIQQLSTRIATQSDLEILVNNAGFGTKGLYHEIASEKLDAMAQVHMTAPVLLSRAALPGMISRHKGSIINVASMAGFFPYRSVLYGSSKAFLIAFSQSLNLQLTGTGVFVQALCPGFTVTEFHNTEELQGFNHRSIPKFLWLRSEQVVRASLNDMHHHREICIPGWQYQFIALFARSGLTNRLIRGLARRIFNKNLTA